MRKFTNGYLNSDLRLFNKLEDCSAENCRSTSAEAEYIAISSTTKELRWLRRLYWKVINRCLFDTEALIPTITIYTDNNAALEFTNQQVVNNRGIYVQCQVSSGEASLSSWNNLYDIYPSINPTCSHTHKAS